MSSRSLQYCLVVDLTRAPIRDLLTLAGRLQSMAMDVLNDVDEAIHPTHPDGDRVGIVGHDLCHNLGRDHDPGLTPDPRHARADVLYGVEDDRDPPHTAAAAPLSRIAEVARLKNVARAAPEVLVQ